MKVDEYMSKQEKEGMLHLKDRENGFLISTVGIADGYETMVFNVDDEGYVDWCPIYIRNVMDKVAAEQAHEKAVEECRTGITKSKYFLREML